MKNEFLEYVTGFESLSEEEAKAIVANIPIKRYKKGTILLREGEVATHCYFVVEGCIRQYRLMDGEEKTTAFYTEEQAVVPFTSYSQKTPSDQYLECTEDSTLVVGNPNLEQDMYEEFPKLAKITRDLMEKDFGKNQEKLASFITSSPEERYLDLLENRPDLFQRVPNHQIASYIGVKPESLSRIKKRVYLKK